MFVNDSSSTLWPCLQWIRYKSFFNWTPACSLCRIGATIILCISIVCFVLNIRYLIWYRKNQRQNSLVLSLFIASLMVLTVSVPVVLLQLFTCHRLCNQVYCRLEGFVSYLAGCSCMLIYMILSINRYLLFCQYNQPRLHRYSAMFCWTFSFLWTFPPVFDYWISYVPEGHGFHCSINWKDRSRSSRFYVLFSFVSIYFIPLLVLFAVNLRVHQILRHIYSSQQYAIVFDQSLSNRKNAPFHLHQRRQCQHIFYDRSTNTMCYIRKAADRKRFRIEYRFIQAMIFLVSTYIIAWTPYSLIAVFQLFHFEFIFHYASLITLSAFIAKLSVILSPILYLSTMHSRLFKKILV